MLLEVYELSGTEGVNTGLHMEGMSAVRWKELLQLS